MDIGIIIVMVLGFIAMFLLGMNQGIIIGEDRTLKLIKFTREHLDKLKQKKREEQDDC